MRVLVQNYTTSEYWRGQNSWTKQEREALDFKTSVEAIEFCVRRHLLDTQVLLRFGEDRFLDIVLPVNPLTGRIGERSTKLTAAA